jgi:hypothetical protein
VTLGRTFYFIQNRKQQQPSYCHIVFLIAFLREDVIINLTIILCVKDDDVKKVEKVKAVQLQAWSDPEGSRKLRFPDFMTTAQDGGKVVSLTGLEWPRGFQEVKVPKFHDNGTGWW